MSQSATSYAELVAKKRSIERSIKLSKTLANTMRFSLISSSLDSKAVPWSFTINTKFRIFVTARTGPPPHAVMQRAPDSDLVICFIGYLKHTKHRFCTRAYVENRNIAFPNCNDSWLQRNAVATRSPSMGYEGYKCIIDIAIRLCVNDNFGTIMNSILKSPNPYKLT